MSSGRDFEEDRHARRRPQLGSQPVPAPRGSPRPPLRRPAGPRPRAAPGPRPHRRPGLRPRQRHPPDRGALAHRPHHRTRQLPGDAGEGRRVRGSHGRRRPPRLRRRGRPDLDTRAALRPDRQQRHAAMGARAHRPPPRLDGRAGSRRHPRLPGARQLRLAQPPADARTRPLGPLEGPPGRHPAPRRRRAHARRVPGGAHRPRLRGRRLGDHVSAPPPGRGPRTGLGEGNGPAPRPHGTGAADAEAFVAEYREALREAYPATERGTVFPFRRVFAVAHKEA